MGHAEQCMWCGVTHAASEGEEAVHQAPGCGARVIVILVPLWWQVHGDVTVNSEHVIFAVKC